MVGLSISEPFFFLEHMSGCMPSSAGLLEDIEVLKALSAFSVMPSFLGAYTHLKRGFALGRFFTWFNTGIDHTVVAVFHYRMVHNIAKISLLFLLFVYVWAPDLAANACEYLFHL